MYFTVENGNVGGFNKPAARNVGGEAGPFRFSAAILRQVEFDPKKLSRKDRKFISSLPKGVAIVGGFARGMYLGNMRDVGDIDLAVWIDKTLDGWDNFFQAIEIFLQDRGYNLNSYTPFFHILEAYLPPHGLGIARWNAMPIKAKHFWSLKREVDVLVSSNPELLDFLNTFDFSLCQFAYLNGRLYATEAALEDVAQKRFHILCDTLPERVEKYVSKGYRLIVDDFAEKWHRGWFPNL